MNIISRTITSVLNLLFPDQCIGCRAPGVIICDQCFSKIPRADHAEYPFIHPVFTYRNDIIKNAIWRLKYGNTRRIAALFGGVLYEEILGILDETLTGIPAEKIILIPIPLHHKRERERGYNQSELLTHAILAHDTAGILEHIPALITRTRATKPQAHAPKRAERLKNLRGAFTRTNTDRVRGKTIVLVDDVATTGATIAEARRTLIASGATRVIAVTVAH